MASIAASGTSSSEPCIGWAERFLSSAPRLVGNLEGVPFDQRDYANRQSLAEDIATFAHPVAAVTGRSAIIDSGTTGHLLDQVTAALVAPPGSPARHLVSLDPTGAGTASIVIGDLDSADFVSYLVPGMFYTVDTQMVGWTDAAQAVYDTEVEWLATLAETDPRLDGATVATVAWIGYETPGMGNFTTLDLAYGGRDAIAASINAVRTLRGAEQPFLSVIGHSYGSTAAMMALADFRIEVDALAVVGSPGSDATTAAALGVAGDNVFVGEADWDQVKDTAFFGVDPGTAAFGAHRFSVDGGVDPLTGATLASSTGHDAYFEPGSESLRNLALIALGKGYLVTTDAPGAIVAKAFGGLNGAGG